MSDFSGKLYAEDLGRGDSGLLTTDRGELWNGSPYDYHQRGNATAMNISPQSLYNNSSMGGYMDSIMGGIMGSSPFMQGGGMPQMRRPQQPQQQYGGLMNQKPTEQPAAPQTQFPGAKMISSMSGDGDSIRTRYDELSGQDRANYDARGYI